jgi:hypothetical protein
VNEIRVLQSAEVRSRRAGSWTRVEHEMLVCLSGPERAAPTLEACTVGLSDFVDAPTIARSGKRTNAQSTSAKEL